MARKRMLDPNIWASEDIAMLSVFARLLFIGMISNADDEGKGRANAAFLKSTIFPYDEDINIRKINDALKSIEEHCSVEVYTVDGKQYYRFKNWKNWQKVEKPSPSRIPNPPQSFGERSGNSRGTFVDLSLRRHKEERSKEEKEVEEEKEEEVEEEINISSSACASVRACEDSENEQLQVVNSFILKTGIEDAYYVDGIDYTALAQKISESDYLQSASSFYWIASNYHKIMENAYKTHKITKKHFANERKYTQEELDALITDVDEIDI